MVNESIDHENDAICNTAYAPILFITFSRYGKKRIDQILSWSALYTKEMTP